MTNELSTPRTPNQESIFVDIQVSGVYLSTGDTVVNRKAYLWEFEYLVCIYLREQHSGQQKANSEKKTGTVYLSLFSEKVVLCVVLCYVLSCLKVLTGFHEARLV